jgi:hypothetical protein
VNAPLRRSAGVAFIALITSSATLVCCVLPAAMVSVGAGATLAAIISAFPQLVWLSEHKAFVFGCAALMLTFAAVALWRARSLPCPVDPAAAIACLRMRRLSAFAFAIALIAFATSVVFAFVLPWFQA